MGNRRAAVVLACAVLGACSGGGDEGVGATSTSTSTTSTTPAPDESTTTTAVDDEEGIGELESVLPSLLIGPGELGDPTLADVGYTPPADDRCGTPVATAGTGIGSPSGLLVVETLQAYETVDDAVAAFERCRPEPGTDVTAEVGGDEAVQGPDAFVARVADVTVSVRFEGEGGPDRAEVAAFAVGKVIAYLEAGAPG